MRGKGRMLGTFPGILYLEAIGCRGKVIIPTGWRVSELFPLKQNRKIKLWNYKIMHDFQNVTIF